MKSLILTALLGFAITSSLSAHCGKCEGDAHAHGADKAEMSCPASGAKAEKAAKACCPADAAKAGAKAAKMDMACCKAAAAEGKDCAKCTKKAKKDCGSCEKKCEKKDEKPAAEAAPAPEGA